MSGSVSASTVAMASLAVVVAGAGMSAIGQANQANAAAASASYQAGMMRNAQLIAQKNADDAI